MHTIRFLLTAATVAVFVMMPTCLSASDRTRFGGLEIGFDWSEVSAALAAIGAHCMGEGELSLFAEPEALKRELADQTVCHAVPDTTDFRKWPADLVASLHLVTPSPYMNLVTVSFYEGVVVRLWMPISFAVVDEHELSQLGDAQDITKLWPILERAGLRASFAWDGTRYVSETLAGESLFVLVDEERDPPWTIEARRQRTSP